MGAIQIWLGEGGGGVRSYSFCYSVHDISGVFSFQFSVCNFINTHRTPTSYISMESKKEFVAQEADFQETELFISKHCA